MVAVVGPIWTDTALVTHGVETGGVNSGNGSVTINAVCFVARTHILTERGEMAIENLAVGDLIVTASGAH